MFLWDVTATCLRTFYDKTLNILINFIQNILCIITNYIIQILIEHEKAVFYFIFGRKKLEDFKCGEKALRRNCAPSI